MTTACAAGAQAETVRLWQSLGFAILTTLPEAFDHREHGLVGLHVLLLRL